MKKAEDASTSVENPGRLWCNICPCLFPVFTLREWCSLRSQQLRIPHNSNGMWPTMHTAHCSNAASTATVTDNILTTDDREKVVTPHVLFCSPSPTPPHICQLSATSNYKHFVWDLAILKGGMACIFRACHVADKSIKVCWYMTEYDI
jgi:hypothetical protein